MKFKIFFSFLRTLRLIIRFKNLGEIPRSWWKLDVCCILLSIIKYVCFLHIEIKHPCFHVQIFFVRSRSGSPCWDLLCCSSSCFSVTCAHILTALRRLYVCEFYAIRSFLFAVGLLSDKPVWKNKTSKTEEVITSRSEYLIKDSIDVISTHEQNASWTFIKPGFLSVILSFVIWS